MPARPASRYAMETEQAYTIAKKKQRFANFWIVILICASNATQISRHPSFPELLYNQNIQSYILKL